jgi:hypothetical protein
VEVSSIGSVAERSEDAERFQVRAQREVVVLVARKAREVEHDHKVHAALIQPTVREQVLELAPISGLGALAFLVEAFEDLVALAAAVLFARAELRWQTEVLGLLLRADANVDHRADHGWQLSRLLKKSPKRARSPSWIVRRIENVRASLRSRGPETVGTRLARLVGRTTGPP